MSTTFDNAYIQQYDTTLNLSFQQMESRLLGTVQVDQMAGVNKYFERLGVAPTPQVQAARFSPIQGQDIAFSRRLVTPVSYRLPILVDTIDKIRMAIDPSSEIVKSQMFSFHRLIDDTIITNLTGTANTQNAVNGAVTPVSFNSANTVALNYVATGSAANSNLTVEKVKYAKQLLVQAEAVMPGERIFVVLNESNLNALFRDSLVNNIFTNDVKPLVSGEMSQFMGMTFIRSERLPFHDSTQANVLVYTESAMKFAWLQPLHGRIDLRADLGEVWQLLSAASFSGVRMWEEKVVQIICDTAL